MRKIWGWVKGSRKHRIVTGTLATFLVAGAAFAYYSAVINDGTGTATYPNALGANNNTPTTFAIVQNTNVNPSNLQPAAAGCKGTSGTGTLASPGNNCAGFNLYLDATNTTVNGQLESVTLTGVDLPQGCPSDSVHVIWPDGTVDGTYTYATPIAFQAGTVATNNDMFPQQSGLVTQSDQPLLEFLNNPSENQNACASGQVVLHFSAHAAAQ